MIAGRTVLDTVRASFLRDRHPAALYAPLEDFDEAVLSRTDHSTHCPFKATRRIGR